jgi:hypothetical protein
MFYRSGWLRCVGLKCIGLGLGFWVLSVSGSVSCLAFELLWVEIPLRLGVIQDMVFVFWKACCPGVTYGIILLYTIIYYYTYTYIIIL